MAYMLDEWELCSYIPSSRYQEVANATNFIFLAQSNCTVHGSVHGLDHIFIRLGPPPLCFLQCLVLLLHMCENSSSLGTNVIIITNTQVDVTFIIPKLIDEVPSHAKGV